MGRAWRKMRTLTVVIFALSLLLNGNLNPLSAAPEALEADSSALNRSGLSRTAGLAEQSINHTVKVAEMVAPPSGDGLPHEETGPALGVSAARDWSQGEVHFRWELAASDEIEIRWDALTIPDPNDPNQRIPAEGVDHYALKWKVGGAWVTLKETKDDFYFLHAGLPEASFADYRLDVYDETGESEYFLFTAATDHKNERPILSGLELGLYEETISADGSAVVFMASGQDPQLPGSADGKTGLYLYRQAGNGSIVRLDDAASDMGGAGPALAISGDGRYIAYPKGSYDKGYGLYRFDTVAGTSQLVALPGPTGFETVGISGDGGKLVFDSSSTDLVQGDTNEVKDVFLYDFALPEAERLRRISLTTDGGQAQDDSLQPAISADGRYVAFVSEAWEYVPDKDDSGADRSRLYLYDMHAVTHLEIVDEETDSGTFTWPSLSADGSKISYLNEYNRRKVRIGVYDRSQSAEIWHLGTINNISMDGPKLTGDGNFVYVKLHNADIYSPAEPYRSRAYVRYDIREENTYRYVGRPLADSSLSLSEDGTRGVFAYERYPNPDNEEVSSEPQGIHLRYVCLASCSDTPPPGDAVTKASIELPQQVNGAVPMNGPVIIRALAQPNLQLQANIAYKLAGQDDSLTATVPLVAAADEPRAYRADWTVPAGAREIVSVRVQPKDKPENGKTADGVPVEVAGALKVKLTTADAAQLKGARVSLWSPTAKLGGSTAFSDKLDAVIAARAASDYTLRVVDADGRLLKEMTGIAVRAGEQSELSVAVVAAAQLVVAAIDERSNPVANVQVEVRGADGGELLYGGKTAGDGRLAIAGSYFSGQEVQIKLTAPAPYQSPAPQKVTLKAGGQEHEIKLVNLDFGTLEGTALVGGKPVAGVTVKLLANYGGILGKTVTDAQGHYELRAPAGEYAAVGERTEAPLYLSQQHPVTLREGRTDTLNIPLSDQGFGRIKLDVKVRHIDGSVEPVAITDWRAAVHYSLQVKALNAAQGYRLNAVDERGIPVYGTPGDTLEVCASGQEAGLSGACAQVTLNDAREAVATLVLKEAARLSGKVVNYTATTYGFFQWRENESEYWRSGKSLIFNDKGEYLLTMPYAGQYRLNIKDNGGLAYQLDGAAAQDQWVRLPPVTLTADTLRFAEKPGNGYAQDDLRAAPSGTASLQAAYRLDGTVAVDNAALIVSVPAGTSLLAGSVMLNRTQVAATDEGGGTYAIALGRLEPGAQGTLSYRISLDEAVPDETLHQVFIRYGKPSGVGTNQETIGSAYVRTADITLEAPETASQRSFTVSGRAPAGKRVLVYADRALVGSAQATAGGLWFAKIELPDRASDLVWRQQGAYRLTAGVEEETGYAESRPALVEFDPDAPAVVEMSMRQDGGRAATFSPADGIARFPFVIVPGQSIFIDMRISHAERISNPTVKIGNLTAELTESEPGQFQAVIVPQYNLGTGVFVSYDTAPAAIQARTEEPTAEQWEAQQAALAADGGPVQGDVLNPSTDGPDPEAAYTPTYKVVFPDKDHTEAHVRMSLKAERLGGDPVPYRGFEPTLDSTGVLTVKGSISRAALTNDQLRELAAFSPKLQSLADPGDPLSTDYLGITLAVAFPKAEKFNTALGILGGLKSYVSDTMDFMDYSDQLLQFQDYVVQNECHAPSVKYFVDQTELLFDMASSGLVVKNAITGIGLVAGVALSKLPAWVTGSAGLYMTAINDAVMSNWNKRLDDLKKEFEDNKKWRDKMAEAGAIDRCKKKEEKEEEPQKKVADPVWIWDPSGYVYEAVSGNRIEGVTATLLQEDLSHAGDWKEWDADWYGQTNPLVTDAQGKYGWDVPEGKWRVLFSKDGYLPAQSEDLTVLPPHFDVNVAMVSLDAPVPAAGQAVVGKPIGLAFSKYMVADTVISGGIIMENAAGDQVNGRIEAVDPQTDEAGQTLARSFRFVLDEPAAAGETYRMRVLAHVQTYAHVGMDMERAFDLTVLPADTPVQEAASGLKAIAGQRELLAEWNRQGSADAKLYRLTATPQGRSGCEPIAAEIGADRSSASFTGLCPGTDYALRLTTLDFNGAESAGIAATVRTKDAAALQVDTTPPGEPANVSAQWANDQLSVAWTDPADADLRHVEVSYRVKGESEFGHASYAAKGEQRIRLTGLDASKSYEIMLRSFDQRLNGSAGVIASGTSEPGGNPGGNPGGHGGDGDPADPMLTEIDLDASKGEHSLFEGTLRLTYPAGVYKEPRKLKIKHLPIGSYPHASGLIPLSPAFSLTLDQSAAAPAKPTVLQIKYDPALLKGQDARKLGVYRQDPANPANWVYVGGVVDVGASTVRAEVSEWGAYAVFLRDISFADAQGHWSRPEVEVLASRGLLSGVAPGRFEPNRQLTRAEAVKLLLSLLRASGKLEEPQAGADGIEFADVRNDSWYAADVKLASRLGLVQGAGSRFRPNDPMTREELATIVYRASIRPSEEEGANGDDWMSGYKDAASIAAWAIPGMRAAVTDGWLKGRTASTLVPKANITRGEAAVILYRLLDGAGLIEDQN
ncbi:S-layer homology domain-containing protein [Cohnella hashimotonis]|uniref:S-layer homology domain-containing protein n=1 Tax=Cohnella hashimotonis TaxID=2826895 RepID=A0ABT6TR24_9BACL|nr:S-layer homology domain-containing protein [Cohnella hashimotonis]MDI4649293.1 S-layer homology domain-containing protein [Cohnella hashimotonis]